MDLQQFRYVIALAEEGNFTRAAAKCFVVQSALSHQIKNLENELGVELFSRTSRRVEITAAGEAFLSAARASLKSAEQAAVEAAAVAGQVRGRLSIGVIPTVTAINVAAALKVFLERHPQVRITLRVAGSDELESAITRGDLDVALLGLPQNRPPHGVAWRHLSTDRLVAVVSNEHSLADHREIELSDLAQETFVDFPTGSLARAESDPAFIEAGVQREVICETMATDFTINLIRQNLAVTLLPSRYALRYPDLVSLPIANGPSRIEYLAWDDFNPSPATHAFLKVLE
ncbi:LysR family transcriptional regulator [Arthrobacter ginkgonis]|uniref:LysR family transcriptional regulator n=2 Tax=Actinomycetes TaxID=1760 RepID=A0ABP7D2Q1_9MICC